MESESPREHQPTELNTSLEALIDQIGFVESDDLRVIRELAIEASTSVDTERVRALLLEYQQRGEEQVNSLDGGDYMRGQVGLIVAKATLNKAVGNIDAFLNDIKDAKDYAYEIFDDDIVSTLEKVPSQEIARVLLALGEEYGFDEVTLAEIAAEPYEHAFEMAYGYLMQAGLDADEVLSAFMDSA